MLFRFFFYQILAVALLLARSLGQTEAPLHQDDTASLSSKQGSAHTPGQRREMPGIPDFVEITPFLFRGSVPTHEGLQALARSGIQIIVDTRVNWTAKERKEARKLGMRYVKISWRCPFPKDKVFARFLKLLRDNPGKKVYVHCLLGDDRTGMMIAAYRMADEGWTAEEAIREMRQYGFTKSHHFICPELARYEASFPHRLKTHKAFKDLRQ
jgi:Dual specificity phosphatase, catalytic domain